MPVRKAKILPITLKMRILRLFYQNPLDRFISPTSDCVSANKEYIGNMYRYPILKMLRAITLASLPVCALPPNFSLRWMGQNEWDLTNYSKIGLNKSSRNMVPETDCLTSTRLVQSRLKLATQKARSMWRWSCGVLPVSGTPTLNFQTQLSKQGSVRVREWFYLNSAHFYPLF